MIITRMRWADVPDGALIVGPSGRVYVLQGKFADLMNRPRAALGDPTTGDRLADPVVNPNAETEVIISSPELESATETLSRFFALERVKP